MLAERRHHVIVERHGCVDVGFAGSVEVETQLHLGFAGFTNDGCSTCHVATPFAMLQLRYYSYDIAIAVVASSAATAILFCFKLIAEYCHELPFRTVSQLAFRLVQPCSTMRSTSTNASRNRAISSSVPMHTRIQPSGPTTRMSTPRFNSSSKMRSRSSKWPPKRTASRPLRAAGPCRSAP